MWWNEKKMHCLKPEQALNGEKKPMEGKWDIINKNGHSTFRTAKPGNFNSLREVIWLIHYDTVTLTLIEMRVSAKKSVVVINGACPWSSSIIPADIVIETRVNRVKNCSKVLIIRIRSYLLKEQFQIQSTETPFCICLWSNNQVISKFYYLLIFSPCFN